MKKINEHMINCYCKLDNLVNQKFSRIKKNFNSCNLENGWTTIEYLGGAMAVALLAVGAIALLKQRIAQGVEEISFDFTNTQ